MKPGKPTTFAIVPRSDNRHCLVFGLPGNPVSCLVTKTLLVDPAIRRLSGSPDDISSMAPEIQVSLSAQSSKLALDDERPEYHRVTVAYDKQANSGRGGYVACSTGVQRSSRLMSLRRANALVCLVVLRSENSVLTFVAKGSKAGRYCAK